MGGNYRRETTVFQHGFNDQKASGYLNLHHLSPDQKLNIQLSINYGIENSSLPTADLTQQVFRLAPDAPTIFDSLGNLNWENGSFNNPFSIFKRKYQSKTENTICNLIIDYKLFSGLHIKVNTGFTSVHVDESTAYPLSSLNPSYGYFSGHNYFSTQSQKTWIIEPQVTYSVIRNWGKLDALVGGTFQNSLTEGQVLLAEGFTSDELIEDISNASSITPQGTNYAQYRYSALFGRLTFNVQDKYLVNLTARHDGSSRFGPGKQFNDFGAIGAAWVFSKIKGFQTSFPWIGFGKLRVSYGVTGNDQIGDYQYIPTWTSSYYSYGNSTGIYPVNLYDPSYSWEVNKKWETGLELSFWKERLSLSASYFQSHSGNQLINQPLPGLTGFTGIQVNLPATVRNTGWEFSLTSNILNLKNFTWSITGNLTVPQNRLTSFPGLNTSVYAYTYAVGQPLSVYQSFHYTGVDSKTGVYNFTDVDHDGMISYPNDLETRNSIVQKYYGGLENNLHWKRLQLNIFFQFIKQTGYNYTYFYPGVAGSAINQPDIVLARWKSADQTTTIQKFTQSYATDAYQAFSNYRESDETISDASYIRLKTLGVSYLLPFSTSHGRQTQVKIYLQGQNLLTITHYKGMDPENQTIYSIPPLKVFVAGVQIIL